MQYSTQYNTKQPYNRMCLNYLQATNTFFIKAKLWFVINVRKKYVRIRLGMLRSAAYFISIVLINWYEFIKTDT